MSINETINIYDRGKNRPVIFGIWLKQAYNVLSATNLRLQAAGANIPASFMVSSRWGGPASDTSKPIKLLHIAFQGAASPRTLQLVDTAGTVPGTTNPLAIVNNSGDFTVSNGLMQVVIPKTGFDLLSSFQTAGVERLTSTKPKIQVPVLANSQALGSSPYVYSGLAGDSTIKVADTSIFSVGQVVSFSYARVVTAYYDTGSYATHPIIVTQGPPFPIDITTGFTPKINVRLHPGTGNQQDVELYFSDQQGLFLNVHPTVAPTVGEVVHIKDVDLQGNLTIQSIDAGNSTITFTAPLSQTIPQGTVISPAGGGTINAGMKVNSTTIERQYGDIAAIIRQQGVMANPNSGTQLNASLRFDLRWYVYADKGYVRARFSYINGFQTFTTDAPPDILLSSLIFNMPLATASSTVSDETMDMATSVSRYKAGTGDSVLTHSAISGFKFVVPELAQMFPKRHTVDSSGYTWEIFPSISGGTTLKGGQMGSRRTFDCIFGTNADIATDVLVKLGVTFDPVYICATKGIRPNLVEKRDWPTVFADQPQKFKDACAHYEKLVATGYNLAVCEDITSSRVAMTFKEYRTTWPEVQGLTPNYYPFGWDKWGTTPEDVGFTNNRYDLPYVWMREGCRESDPTLTEKAWQLAFENIRHRMELGQGWSHYSWNGTFVDFFGLAQYERSYAPSIWDPTNQPAPTHSWNEGNCLYWALTDCPIAKEAAIAGCDHAAQYDYQGTYGARYQGTGAYVLKDPATGNGIGEPRYVGWPILNLITGWRYFGDSNYLQKAIDYTNSFIVTQAGEPQDDGYTDYKDDSGNPQPAFQYGGYVMHGIVETWREVTGSTQTAIGNYIAKVAQWLFKGDQRLSSAGPDSPTIGNGHLHPQDSTKYNPATWFPFTWKRSLADSLSANINNSQNTIPVTDATTFLLHGNGDFDTTYPTRAIGAICGDVNDPTTWEYFQYTGKTGNTLTGVVRGWGGTTAIARNAGAVVLPCVFDGALNDVIVAALIAGARVTGQQQLQDRAQQIWEDNCLYRDVYAQGTPLFATVGTYSKKNFWPSNIGYTAPKTYGQTSIALSEFLGDRVNPQPIPAVSSITPNVIASGSGNTQITVTGSNFDPTATVKVNGTAITTVFVNSTSLTATIPSGTLSAAATLAVIVVNPISGNQSTSTNITVADAPTISSLFPTSANQNGAAFILTVNGTHLDANCVVRWGGANRTTTLVGSTLQAQIPQGDLVTAGSFNITVLNTVTGLVSNATAFTVTAQNNPTPSLSSLSPNSATAGDSQLTLTINGTGFVSGAVAKWGSTNLTTNFVSGTQVTAVVPTGLLTTAGTFAVTVVNPSPGGGASNALNFTIGAIVQPPPAPSISSLSPNSVTAGSAQFTVTINGSNFDSSCIARWNGVDLSTTYVSASQITAVIPSANITAPTTASITVRSVDNSQTSNGSTFTVNAAPVPSITSISPTTAIAGGAQFSLTVNGSNFASDAVVRWNGVDLSTTYVSASQVTAIVPSGYVSNPLSVAVTVRNASTGQTSSSSTFTVLAIPSPTLASISPASTTQGASQLTLALTGGNFVAGSVVRWNGNPLQTTYVSGTQLTAIVDASLLTAPGTGSVTVFNPSPGGGVSNTATFTINSVAYPVPGITSLSPQTAVAGSGQLNLTVNGANFANDAVVKWNGVDLVTTYVSGTQLTAIVPAGNVATAGSATVTVRNTTTGQVSSGTSFAITAPPSPQISSLSPSSTVAGSGQLSLTVNGANFATDAVVLWNGVALSTTFISNSQLTAIVPGVNVAAATTAAVAIRNVGTQQVSSSSQFSVSALPSPAIGSISPNTANVGDSQLTLTVTGTNFQSGAAVRVNGQQRATAFVSSTQLTATITSGDLATVASLLITVLNPDSQASAPASLQVQQPPPGLPTVTSISPASATPGLYQQLVTVSGTNFTLGSIVRVGGVNRPTQYLSSSLLQVTLLETDLFSAGTLQLSVYTPPPGGGTSDSVNLPVTAVSSTAPRIRPDMAPDRRTLYIRQGKTFRLSTRVYIGRDIVNLTNCDARFQIRKRFADEENPPAPLQDLTVANGGIVIDPANGYIVIQMTPAQTEAYKTPRAMFELEVTDNTSQIVVGILEGDIRLQREIVR